MIIRLDWKDGTIGSSIKNSPTEEEMIALHNECFPEELTKEMIQSFPTVVKFVLYADDIPVGIFWLERKTKYICYMTTFAIKKEYRRLGMGTLLFTYMTILAASAPSDYVLFDSYTSDTNANAFYDAQKDCERLYTTENSILWKAKLQTDLNKYLVQPTDSNGKRLDNCKEKGTEEDPNAEETSKTGQKEEDSSASTPK